MSFMNKHGGYYGNARNVIDYSVNLNPLGLSESVKVRIPELLEKLEGYPELTCEDARTRLAIYLNCRNRLYGQEEQHQKFSPENVILGNGATELIYLFARSFKPQKVLLIQPTFNEYERAFKQTGAKCIHFQLTEEEEFAVNISGLITVIKETRPDVVMLCNPNNPTGSALSELEIEPIYEAIKSYNGILCLDESFAEFELAEQATYPLESVFRIRSMTKFYAIAGIRLGYGIGSKHIIECMESYKEPWTLNIMAMEILPWLLEDADYVAETMSWYNTEKHFLKEAFCGIKGLTAYTSHANFFLCKTTISGKLLSEMLMDHGIFIRTCEDFVGLGDDFIRLAVKKHEDNVHLVTCLTKIMGKKEGNV